MIIAQISDLHLRTDGVPLKRIVDSVEALEHTIHHLNVMEPRPDVVLATGDLANKAHEQDYKGLKLILDQLKAPYYVIPGNHDDRQMMLDTFVEGGHLPHEGPFMQYCVEDWPVRLIGLDTKAEGRDGGEMCAERLQWLDDRLSEQPERPTLIFMHHPPFKTGMDFADKSRFPGAEELDALLRKYNNIERIICGHLHRTISTRFGGTVISVASSTAFQMALDLRRGVESSLILEPPRLPILVWREDIGLVGHTSLVGDFGPRHPFVRDPMGPVS